MSAVVISLVLLSLASLGVHALRIQWPKSPWEALLRLYYRSITLEGDVPESDLATLVVANHANAFIDPFALEVALNRPLVRTVRADWAKHWFVKWFVKCVGAIPLAPSRLLPGQCNQKSFRQLNEALQNGQWVVVFPEGISHNRSQLRPFRNGAVTMARQYVEATGKPIRVVQMALTYGDKSRLDSDVWAQVASVSCYGSAEALKSADRISEQWRDTIQACLPDRLTKPEREHLNWLKNQLLPLTQTREAAAAISRSPSARKQTRQLRQWLGTAGMDLGVLLGLTSNQAHCRRLFSEGLIFVTGLPFAMIGLISHLPALALHYLLICRQATAEDKWASNAFIIGIPLYSLYWLALAPAAGFGATVATTACGLYALWYWRSWERRKSALLTAFLSFSYPATRRIALQNAEETIASLTHHSFETSPRRLRY